MGWISSHYFDFYWIKLPSSSLLEYCAIPDSNNTIGSPKKKYSGVIPFYNGFFFVFVYYVRLRQPIFRTLAGFWVWGWSVVSDIVLKKKHPRIWRSEHSFHSWCFWRSKYGIVIDPLSHWRIIIMLFIFAKTWRTSRTSCSYCKNWSLQVALILTLIVPGYVVCDILRYRTHGSFVLPNSWAHTVQVFSKLVRIYELIEH